MLVGIFTRLSPMPESFADLADTLLDRFRHLLMTCRESAYQLEFAAHHLGTAQAEMAARLERMAGQRRQCAQQIVQRIQSLGYEVELNDTMLTTMSRRWAELRANVIGPKPQEVLEDVITHEREALTDYDNALEEVMDSTSLQLVLEHRAHLEMCLREIEGYLSSLEENLGSLRY